MNSLSDFLLNRAEKQVLPCMMVSLELEIDTFVLRKIERSEHVATKEILRKIAKNLEVQEKGIELKFLKKRLGRNAEQLKAASKYEFRQ